MRMFGRKRQERLSPEELARVQAELEAKLAEEGLEPIGGGTSEAKKPVTFERFLKENYSGGSDPRDIYATAVDGFQRVIVEDGLGDIEGGLTYNIDIDADGEKYLVFGVIVVKRESRGGGIAGELFQKLLTIAKNSGCSYITAKADTRAGKQILEGYGFNLRQDKRTGQNYYHLDI